MLRQRVILQLLEFHHPIAALHAQITVIDLFMFGQTGPSIAFVIANIAFVFDFAGMDPFVQRDRQFAFEIFHAESAFVGFVVDVGQFLVLLQTARSQKFSLTFGALESALFAPMELRPVLLQALRRAHVPDRIAFQAQPRRFAIVIRQFVGVFYAFVTLIALDEIYAIRMFTGDVPP